MLGEEVWADENYWHVVVVAGEERWVVINVHFLQAGAKRFEDRDHGGFGFFAEVAAFAHIHGDVARGGEGQAAFFGAAVEIAAAVGEQQTLLDEIRYCVENSFAFGGIVAADEFEEGVQVERWAVELVESGEDSLRDCWHGVLARVTMRAPGYGLIV